MENYTKFEKIFLEGLDKHAPLKKKIMRADNKPYMSKTLRKAIMRKPALKITVTDYLNRKKRSKNRGILLLNF